MWLVKSKYLFLFSVGISCCRFAQFGHKKHEVILTVFNFNSDKYLKCFVWKRLSQI